MELVRCKEPSTLHLYLIVFNYQVLKTMHTMSSNLASLKSVSLSKMFWLHSEAKAEERTHASAHG